jgi:hypothetical protein
MNGLLHRLAARAAGTAVTVRSDARLPYGGGALAWADMAEVEVAAPREAMQGVTSAEQVLPPQASQPGFAEPRPLRPIIVPQAAAPEQAAEPPLAVNPHDAEASAVGAVPAVAGRPEPPMLLRIDEPSARSPVLSEPTRTERPGEPQRSSRTSSSVRVRDAVTPAARAQADPAPLMPLTADRSTPSAPPAAPHRAAGPPAAPVSAADEPNEVHIHIGRIDVTAVHEAPPPRRKQASTQAPMSLDSYLAQRQRSRS